MVRIDAQGQQQGIEGNLHNPGCGESIARLSVGNAYDVNALGQAFAQGRDGTAHVFLRSTVTQDGAARPIVRHPRSSPASRVKLSQPCCQCWATLPSTKSRWEDLLFNCIRKPIAAARAAARSVSRHRQTVVNAPILPPQAYPVLFG